MVIDSVGEVYYRLVATCDVGLYDSPTNDLLTANTYFLRTWTLSNMTLYKPVLAILNTCFEHSIGSAIDVSWSLEHIQSSVISQNFFYRAIIVFYTSPI